MKVGDLVKSTQALRRFHGIGVVLRIIKEKFRPTKAEVCFPCSPVTNLQGTRNYILLSKELRVISE